MILLALLALPALLGLLGRLLGKGRVTWKEFAVHEVVVIAVIGIGYWISISARTSDNEILNGTISRKWQENVHCCHSYSCNPHMCMGTCFDSKGHIHACLKTCWDTCYHHQRDVAYHAVTSNNESVFDDGCNPPDNAPPVRWQQIVVGEPTAIEHGYDNYIQAAPGKFPWRWDLLKKYRAQIPNYPRVYDTYRVRRVLAVGATVSGADILNAKLAEINGRLGPQKHVNILFVLTDVAKPEYADALAAAWFGGKKNDLIVVMGLPSGSEIAWVRVLSWTKVSAVREGIEQRILHLGTFHGEEIAAIVADEVGQRFVRRPMSDFAYLKESIEPTTTALWVLSIIGFLLAIGLQWYFWENDPFGEEAFGRRQW